MINERKSVRLSLECSCHDPRCIVWFEFNPEGWYKNAPLSLDVSIEYCTIGFWNRIKAAWKLLKTGSEKREADVCLDGIEYIHKLKDFVENCLKEMSSEDASRT